MKGFEVVFFFFPLRVSVLFPRKMKGQVLPLKSRSRPFNHAWRSLAFVTIHLGTTPSSLFSSGSSSDSSSMDSQTGLRTPENNIPQLQCLLFQHQAWF